MEAVRRRSEEQMGKLTDDEILQINGNREILAGKISGEVRYRQGGRQQAD